MGDTDWIFARHRDAKRDREWDEHRDFERINALRFAITPHFPILIDDVSEEIRRHPAAFAVITGRGARVSRLKATLAQWLDDLFRLLPDDHSAQRCRRIGRRHAEIGLDPFFVIAALARLRSRIRQVPRSSWIAHEPRSPLNVVKTSVHALKNARSVSAENVNEPPQRIGRGVDRIVAVITALSSFARLQAPKSRPTPLRESARKAIDAKSPDPLGRGPGRHRPDGSPFTILFLKKAP